MATIQNTDLRSLPAGEDLSSVKYYFVTRESDQTVDIADSITDDAMGVLQNSPPDGLEASVKVTGQTKVVAATSLSVGDFVAPASDGRAQVAVNTQFPRGRVVVAAGSGDDLAVIELLQSADDIGGSDTFTTINIAEGGSIVAGTSTGAKIGGAANQKLGLWGVTPVVQPSHNADPAAQGAMTASDPGAMAGPTATDPSKTAAAPDAATASSPSANAGPTQGVYSAPTGLTDPPTKAEMETEFSKIDDDLAEIKVDMAAGKTATDSNKTQIDALIADMVSLRDQLTAAIVDIDDNNSEIDALIVDGAATKTAVDLNNDAIDECIDDIGELDGGVDNNNAAIDELNADAATTGATASS